MTEKKPRNVSLRQTLPWLDKRKGTRVPADHRTHVLVSSATCPSETAVIEDVSFGGAALCLGRNVSLSVGDEVRISRDAGSFDAVVRYALEQEDGAYRIGCTWRDPASPSVEALVRSVLRCLTEPEDRA
jgi:hypothetical protein